MIDYRIGLCSDCGEWACGVLSEWRMTYAGAGWDSYYGPEPPEYDEFWVCAACRLQNRLADEDYERALDGMPDDWYKDHAQEVSDI